jgi:hypothetical protein
MCSKVNYIFLLLFIRLINEVYFHNISVYTVKLFLFFTNKYQFIASNNRYILTITESRLSGKPKNIQFDINPRLRL